MNPNDAYLWLCEYSRESATLASLGSLAGWDQRTNIPEQGHAHRAEQLAVLAKWLHRRATDPLIGERVAEVEGSPVVADPESPAAVNLREWRRDYDRVTRIPERLEVELARATSEGETVWEQARPANDWPRFAPYLARILALKQEEADCLGYQEERYDALLDQYEPGMCCAELEPLFKTLADQLPALIRAADPARAEAIRQPLFRDFPIPEQAAFGREAASAIGFDFAAGRLDVSAHPFTIDVGPGDTRLTTRYHAGYFSGAFFGTLHEAGHGLYEQGLPAEHWGTPRGAAVSLGVHESQSRLWENLVGRSLGFWRHFYPQAQRRFAALADVPLPAFYRAINAVAPSLIRVEADEVTYNLHILVRFELELALLRGTLTVADLPAAFADRMQALLGVRPAQVRDGALQDVHWSGGLIGYFPTYTLGNLYAAQLFEAARHSLGDLEAAFARGEFAPLLGWLRRHVHAAGSTWRSAALVERVTGKKPDPKFLIAHLRRKVEALNAG